MFCASNPPPFFSQLASPRCWVGFVEVKETALKRADFNLQLVKFVTAEKEKRTVIIFFLSSFHQLVSPLFKARTG